MEGYLKKYYSKFYNVFGEECNIDIYKYYADTSILLTPLRLNTINATLIYNYKDMFNPTIGTGLELTVINNLPVWNTFDELLSCYNREWYVKGYTKDSSVLFFEGYLLPEEQEQQIINNSEISLKASNQLAQLKNISDPLNDSIDLFKGTSMNRLIDYVANFLSKTGLNYKIYVNCSVYETSSTNKNLFYDMYLNKHLFCDLNIIYENLYDALNKILKPFNLFIYMWDNAWYIDRLFDYKSPKKYNVFNPLNLDVYPDLSINTVPILNKQQNDFVYIDQTQKVKYLEGYKKIVLTCEESVNPNIVNESVVGALPKASGIEGDTIIGQWYYDARNSVSAGYDDVTFNGTYGYPKRGIYTKASVTKSENLRYFRINARRVVTDANEIANANYYVFYAQIFDWDNNKSLVYSNLTDYKWNYNTIDTNEVCGFKVTELKYDDEEKYYFWELDINVDQLSLSDGNHILEIRLLGGWWSNESKTVITNIYSPQYKKIRITQDLESDSDQEYTAVVTTNYINTLEEDIELFDTTNINSSNLILVNWNKYDSITAKSSNSWKDARTESLTSTYNLQDLYIESLFQQFNKPRKELNATIRYNGFIKPMTILQDDKLLTDTSTADFLLLGYKLDLNNMYYDIKAVEIVANDNEIIE